MQCLLIGALNKSFKQRKSASAVVGDVGDLFLARVCSFLYFPALKTTLCELYLLLSSWCALQFAGEAGEEFSRAIGDFCSNQNQALDALRQRQKTDPRLLAFLQVNLALQTADNYA